MLTELSGCPAWIQTAPWIFLPFNSSSTTSFEASCRRCAILGPTCTALSQVSLDIGLGSSCSQPLLENCPSQMVGSRRILNSMPLASAGLLSEGAIADFAVTDLGWKVVPSTKPSCSDFRQNCSKSAPVCCFCQ